ncbi:adenylyltransferase/cytidyltransferase family protein [Ectobacillus polymachus]|uniref:adenylyltransferase/cytidyltransferase family protein n=1 Tax=Ectobacillus polymachus TaxID=1508806 RepID=UPI003A8B813B
MEVIHVNNHDRNSHLSIGEPCVMALGFFDGVHLGHQQVINTAKRVADEKQLPLVCMSFYPHPKEVLTKGRKTVQYLMPMADKQRVLRKLGVTKFYIVQFDPKFASLSPKQFVHKYLLDFGVTHVVAGFDFTYGCRGEGHMDRMKDDADNMLEVIKVKKVELEGEKISSTLIRKVICSGRVEELHRYLGNHYQIEGKVFASNGAAMVQVKPGYLLPAPGMYEVTISNRKKTWKQEAFVIHEQGTCRLHLSENSSLVVRQTIRIGWIKRLQPEVVIPLEYSSRKVHSEIVS